MFFLYGNLLLHFSQLVFVSCLSLLFGGKLIKSFVSCLINIFAVFFRSVNSQYNDQTKIYMFFLISFLLTFCLQCRILLPPRTLINDLHVDENVDSRQLKEESPPSSLLQHKFISTFNFFSHLCCSFFKSFPPTFHNCIILSVRSSFYRPLTTTV